MKIKCIIKRVYYLKDDDDTVLVAVQPIIDNSPVIPVLMKTTTYIDMVVKPSPPPEYLMLELGGIFGALTYLANIGLKHLPKKSQSKSRRQKKNEYALQYLSSRISHRETA